MRKLLIVCSLLVTLTACSDIANTRIANTQIDVFNVVKDDCKWFDQSRYYLNIESENNGKKTVTIRKISDNLLEAWYEVDPLTGTFTKVILNENLKEYQSSGIRHPEFKFSNSTLIDKIAGTSKILNFDVTNEEDEIKLKASMLKLFGNPIPDSDTYYVINASVNNQIKCYLSIYNGPSGWAIGGAPNDEGSIIAAAELHERIIENTEK